jgi:hypothetical protein
MDVDKVSNGEIYTSEGVCFDGETHNAEQYIVREMAHGSCLP